MDLVARIFDGKRFNSDECQLIAERAPELKEKLGALLRDLATLNRFSSEEEPSGLRYPKGYEPYALLTQVDRLKTIFPNIETARARAYLRDKHLTLNLPEGADGWFAIPRWQELSGSHSYAEAVMMIIKLLQGPKPYFSYCINPDTLARKNIRESERTAKRLERIAKEQGYGDIMFVAAQFGHVGASRSPRRAREVYRASEFGLGAFAAGCMLLTHPERFGHNADLGLLCTGDEVDMEGLGKFTCSTILQKKNGTLHFDAVNETNVFGSKCTGPVTGFVNL